jgi:hypothetical protein
LNGVSSPPHGNIDGSAFIMYYNNKLKNYI